MAALGAAALATFGLSLGGAAPALAHDVLVAATAVGSAESGEAPGLQLEFNNEVMNIGTEMIGVDAAGNSVLDGDPVVDGRSVTQHLVADLASGDYEVAWNVVSSDGHPIQGVLAVTIVDGYPTEVSPAAPDAEHAEPSPSDQPDTGTEPTPEVTTQTDAVPVSADGAGAPITPWVAGAVAIGVVAAVLVLLSRVRRSNAATQAERAGDDTAGTGASADTNTDNNGGAN